MLDFIKGLLEVLPGILILVLAACLYLLPAIEAKRRNHPQGYAIAILNVFLGWTFLGWVIALVWAYTVTPDELVRRELERQLRRSGPQPSAATPDEIVRRELEQEAARKRSEAARIESERKQAEIQSQVRKQQEQETARQMAEDRLRRQAKEIRARQREEQIRLFCQRFADLPEGAKVQYRSSKEKKTAFAATLGEIANPGIQTGQLFTSPIPSTNGIGPKWLSASL